MGLDGAGTVVIRDVRPAIASSEPGALDRCQESRNLIEYEEPLRYRSFLYYCCTRACTSMACRWSRCGRLANVTTSRAVRSRSGLWGSPQLRRCCLLVFVIGHVADRFDRRHIARACELVEALAVIVLCVATLDGAIQPALIYAMVVLLGVGRAFESPASSALLPNLVPATSFRPASARADGAASLFHLGSAIGAFSTPGIRGFRTASRARCSSPRPC